MTQTQQTRLDEMLSDMKAQYEKQEDENIILANRIKYVFNNTDALWLREMMQSFLEQVKDRGSLSDKQMEVLIKFEDNLNKRLRR